MEWRSGSLFDSPVVLVLILVLVVFAIVVSVRQRQAHARLLERAESALDRGRLAEAAGCFAQVARERLRQAAGPRGTSHDELFTRGLRGTLRVHRALGRHEPFREIDELLADLRRLYEFPQHRSRFANEGLTDRGVRIRDAILAHLDAALAERGRVTGDAGPVAARGAETVAPARSPR